MEIYEPCDCLVFVMRPGSYWCTRHSYSEWQEKEEKKLFRVAGVGSVSLSTSSSSILSLTVGFIATAPSSTLVVDLL